MRILLCSVGTRGDMEPFLAIGEALVQAGHEVAAAFPEQFISLAEEVGIKGLSLGSAFIDLLNSDEGKKAMGGSGTTLQKIVSYAKLAKLFKGQNFELVLRQKKAIETFIPDRIIHHPKAIYPIFWEGGHKGHRFLVSPVPFVLHTVHDRPYLVFRKNLGRAINTLTYSLARYALVKTALNYNAKLKGIPTLAFKDVRDALLNGPCMYTLSRELFTPPSNWPNQVRVVGYHARTLDHHWNPSSELLNFLEENPNPLLISFGSMVNPNSKRLSRMMYEELEKMNHPAIINCSSGGLVKIDKAWEGLHFLNQIPYNWILPKVKAMVHHGGSGTTHMCLKHGKPMMIIPHIMDQFMWNDLTSDLGLGPKGPAITALNRKNFTQGLNRLLKEEGFLRKAKLCGMAMEKEGGMGGIVQWVEEGA